jgi:NADPH:quinone reductase-like Zn-dependent oxidoreductase
MAGPTPITTRALVSTSSANPLTISTVPLKNTPLSPNEILIRVHAASINPVDIQLWKSGLVDILTRLGLFSEQKGVGKDFSGVVVKVGTGVTGFNSGEEVWGCLSEVVSVIELLFCLSLIGFRSASVSILSPC